MSKVVLKKQFIKKTESDSEEDSRDNLLSRPRTWYKLEVPGLSQKRPSLMPGDRAIISRYDPKTNVVEYEHEGYIKSVKKNDIFISELDKSFENIFNSNSRFNVRFITNRAAMECAHKAVESMKLWRARLYPEPVPFAEPQKIERFFNPQIGENAEQKAAVEHILSHTSDPAPYLVFGPPGTGKTMTIVESIVQIVKANPNHKVWVCTNSNMAADHVALQLLKYKPLFATGYYLLRVNSKDRDWKCMPIELRKVSNGTSRKKCKSLKNFKLSPYRIVVTTLIHASKYTEPQGKRDCRITVSHLFIDEAAQATEPSCLVPMKLLSPRGQLVLAGDPCQLGPVIMSKLAKEFGLGMSLMEHLYTTYTNLYGAGCAHQHQYITMLVNNFRSDADILAIPNEQFYGGKLKALAPLDPLSRASILGKEGGDRSIVFHSIDGKAQKQGKIPSYMNKGEFKMVQTYITALVDVHKVPPRDIGVISPYLRQVALIKEWMLRKNYADLEVGTVEAFQGKEKRVVIVSTVRSGGTPTGDLRADLGFLVDKQRFNVAVTRAKAKLIVIGNCVFLKQDELWNSYIQRCQALGSYAKTSPGLVQLMDDLVMDDSPPLSPELDNQFDDCPSFSPEMDDVLDGGPSFSPEMDDVLDGGPSFSPEMDDVLDGGPSFSPEMDDVLEDGPSFSPEMDDVLEDGPSFSPEMDDVLEDGPSFSPEMDDVFEDGPSFSPEMDDVCYDGPSFSPEMDDVFDDGPSFSPEMDDVFDDGPSFSPEMDDVFDDGPSFSPEMDDVFDDGPSFSPEMDDVFDDGPSFSPEMDDVFDDGPSFSPEMDDVFDDGPSFSPEMDDVFDDGPSFSPEIDDVFDDGPSFSPEMDDVFDDGPSFSPEMDDVFDDGPSFSPEIDFY